MGVTNPSVNAHLSAATTGSDGGGGVNVNSRERILAAATEIAQAHGYGGLNYRDLAQDVGIRAASIYHHFPSKAGLAAAVAKRYGESSAAELDALSAEAADPLHALMRDNRMCLCSFMAAEFDDLPEPVRQEVRGFADVNVAWLRRTLCDAAVVAVADGEQRARAIFAAVSGAQLVARSRSGVSCFDALIEGYRAAGLLPGTGSSPVSREAPPFRTAVRPVCRSPVTAPR